MAAEADFYSRPAHLISRCARLLTRWGDPRFRALGLAIAQLPVLGMLTDGGTATQKELARMARIEQPTMAQLLARMERDGLIERAPSSNDGRSRFVSLTPAAKQALPQARAILEEGSAVAFQGFKDSEIEMLSRLLQRVVANLDAAIARPNEDI